MGKIIVMASGKGGTGKTTAAANLGVALSQAGNLTVLVDMDIGLRNLDIALGLESCVVFDALEVIEDRRSIDEVIIAHHKYENLYFIAAPQTREAMDVPMEKVADFWERLKSRFDYCIIDAPAGIIGTGFEYAIESADMALIVTLPEFTALRDSDRAIEVMEKKGIEDIFLVVNRVRPEMIQKGLMMNIDECMDTLAIPIAGVVFEDEEITKCSLEDDVAFSKENSLTHKAFLNISKRICGEKVPIIKVEKRKIFPIFKKRQTLIYTDK